MNEEITTKLDISEEHRLSDSKVIHVNFASARGDARDEARAAKSERLPSTEMPARGVPDVIAAPVRRRSTLFPALEAIDLRLPWIVRIAAAIAVIALSLLVF